MVLSIFFSVFRRGLQPIGEGKGLASNLLHVVHTPGEARHTSLSMLRLMPFSSVGLLEVGLSFLIVLCFCFLHCLFFYIIEIHVQSYQVRQVYIGIRLFIFIYLLFFFLQNDKVHYEKVQIST